MSTIEDVARIAGLSRTTVSRVINNHPYVSKAKKQRVVEAMSLLGYVPNSAARSLRNQKTDTIAVLIPRIMNPFFSQLIDSMEMAASERGFKLIVCQTRYSPEKELSYLNLLKTKQVDGIILASIQNEWETVEPYLQYGPIILCNEDDERTTVPVVRADQVLGGYMGAKHLIEQGHTKIAYCCRSHNSKVAKKREIGFTKALHENHLEFEERYAFRNAASIEDGKEIFHQMREMEIKPTAVFTGGDEVAAGIISEAIRHKWDIPNDLAVIGFDNQAITELLQPTITTINQPIHKMATIALNTVIEKISTKNYQSREVHELELELMVRESTFPSKLALI
jgi:LacI family transcriptional regulator, repressor for deo operon, udp, cdd, tsx, nupC, and nupG